MKKVKHWLSPNVGTALLLLAGLTAPASHAAYTVLELDMTPATTPSAAHGVSYSIPFYADRATLGPKGRAAMRSLLQAARQAQTIAIAGGASVEGETVVSAQRAAALKAWLVASGIRATKITTTTSTSVSPSDDANTFNSTITIEDSLPAAQPTAPTGHRKVELVTATSAAAPIAREDIDKIVRLYLNNKIDQEEALSLVMGVVKPPETSTEQRKETRVFSTPGAVPAPGAAHTWRIYKGYTLRAAVQQWASRAGWAAPVWLPRDPYYIEADGLFQGSLIDALTQLNELVPELDFLVSLSRKTITVSEKPEKK